MVHTAVVNEWGKAPVYSTIDLPPPTASQHRIKIISAGLHNLVRSRALGKHFSIASDASPPHYPGADGVGTVIPSGEVVYFNSLLASTGSFASEINVEQKDCFVLPPGADPDLIASLANPTMSGWMALTARAGIVPGQAASRPFSVAIVGATGASGHAAVQVAKALGASKIVAIGKPGPKLEKSKSLGATHTIELAGADTDFASASDVDVVLDYLWGSVAELATKGIMMARKERSRRISWVHIGSLAGDEAKISAVLLRKANLVFMGCGPGAWTFQELYEQMPGMLEAMVSGGFTADFKVERLEDIEKWWGDAADGERRLVKP